MECLFSKRELRLLDDLLPESKKNVRKGMYSTLALVISKIKIGTRGNNIGLKPQFLIKIISSKLCITGFWQINLTKPAKDKLI